MSKSLQTFTSSFLYHVVLHCVGIKFGILGFCTPCFKATSRAKGHNQDSSLVLIERIKNHLMLHNDVQVQVRTWTWLGLKSDFYWKWTWLGLDLNILKCGGLGQFFKRADLDLTWLDAKPCRLGLDLDLRLAGLAHHWCCMTKIAW